jgi:hypothetical protein
MCSRSPRCCHNYRLLTDPFYYEKAFTNLRACPVTISLHQQPDEVYENDNQPLYITQCIYDSVH